METKENIASVKIFCDGTAFLTSAERISIYCERKYAVMASLLIGSEMQPKAVLNENGDVVNIII